MFEPECVCHLLVAPRPGRQPGSSSEALCCFGQTTGLAQAHAPDREEYRQFLRWTKRLQVSLSGLVRRADLKWPVAVIIVLETIHPSTRGLNVEPLTAA